MLQTYIPIRQISTYIKCVLNCNIVYKSLSPLVVFEVKLLNNSSFSHHIVSTLFFTICLYLLYNTAKTQNKTFIYCLYIFAHCFSIFSLLINSFYTIIIITFKMFIKFTSNSVYIKGLCSCDLP